MKQSQIVRIVIHPVFISLVLSILAFLLFNINPSKYRFEILAYEARDTTGYSYSSFYADLDSDGASERILFDNDKAGNSIMVAVLPNDFPMDQWNFSGVINTLNNDLYKGDYNHDQNVEIASFSLDSNRILLNLVEPFGRVTHLVKNLLVDTINSPYMKPILVISDCRFHDLNNDQSDELVFSLCAGLAPQPRAVYAYDIRNKKLWSSPFAGSFLRELMIVDLDGDSHPEITGHTYAADNYSDGNILMPDTCCWMIIYDESLRLKTPPVPIGQKFNHLWPVELNGGPQKTILYLQSGMKGKQVFFDFFNLSSDLTIQNVAVPINPDITINAIVRSADNNASILIPLLGQAIHCLSGNQWVEWSSPNKSSDWVRISNAGFGPSDIQYVYHRADVKDEFVFLNHQGRETGSLHLSTVPGIHRLNWIGLVDGNYRFVFSDPSSHTHIEMSRNPWRDLRYLLIPALFAGFFAFISLIRVIQARQIAHKEATRKEILQLQLKSVRNQLDPHFTFNALNALSSLSHAGDQRGVDHFISHFSRLLRSHLNTSDQVLIPLREEIEFVVNFAELQRIRFDNFFRLELDIDTEVNLNREIPKMLIQTHVENAIKHGLRPLFEKMKASRNVVSNTGSTEPPAGDPDGQGRVWIHILDTGNNLKILVEDNGCGLGNSTTSSLESTGTGLRSVDRIISSVKDLYRMDIRQTFEKRCEAADGNCGTRVIIEIRN